MMMMVVVMIFLDNYTNAGTEIDSDNSKLKVLLPSVIA